MAKKGTPISAHDAPEAQQLEQTRSGFLRGAIAAFLAFHKQWQDDENAPNPPEAYWDKAAEVVQAFAAGDIPEDCRPLVNPVDALRVEANVFDTRSDTERQYPHYKFWVAVEGLEKAIAGTTPPPDKPKLESMHDLRSGAANDGKPVSVKQIALMWGCTEDEVNRELAKPGSVCTPSFCAAAEAARDRPTTKEGLREKEPINLQEVADLLLGDTSPAEVMSLTGADAATVAKMAKRLREQPSQPVGA